jgi:hypothetical protein
MKKILVSSLSLYNYVDKCLQCSEFPEHISIITLKDKLLMPIMDKEQQGIYFYEKEGCGGAKDYDCLISIGQLYKLRKILDIVGEQPIVLQLDAHNNCIHISEAII